MVAWVYGVLDDSASPGERVWKALLIVVALTLTLVLVGALVHLAIYGDLRHHPIPGVST
jgi:hypothetical protein